MHTPNPRAHPPRNRHLVFCRPFQHLNGFSAHTAHTLTFKQPTPIILSSMCGGSSSISPAVLPPGKVARVRTSSQALVVQKLGQREAGLMPARWTPPARTIVILLHLLTFDTLEGQARSAGLDKRVSPYSKFILAKGSCSPPPFFPSSWLVWFGVMRS